MLIKRIAAIAEVLLVLALGNLIGEWLFTVMIPEPSDSSHGHELAAAFQAGLLIFLRLGTAGALGLLLLYLRKGITPRQAGLSLNNHSLSHLLAQGVVFGLLASFLVTLLFAAHDLIPFGKGLDAWWTYSETPIDLPFWIYVLGTSVFIPPLTEEIMTRGYFRMRLIESFGIMPGVILTAVIFGLSHTRYLAADGMLLLFLAIILINSTTWTYLTQKTGSILPAFLAHALSNGIATIVLFNIWIPFALLTVTMLLLRKPMLTLFRSFVADWHAETQKRSLVHGILVIVTILIAALLVLSTLGRTPTLLVLGTFCLLVTVANLILELRMRSDPEQGQSP